MNVENISIVVPCRNEEKYIAIFLDSIINNDYPKEYLEVFIIDGMSSDNTQQIVRDFTCKFNFIKLLFNEKRTVPYALNKGINCATGNYIIRLDAHSEIPYNYFTELIKFSNKLNADNIGTTCITDVKTKNPKSIAIKKILSHKFGVGNSYFRVGADEIKEVDTVPFGCYKKDIFNNVGMFNEKLNRNQDIELNKRITRSGGRIILLQHISSTYYARESYFALAVNNYKNGFWNILTVYITKRLDSLSFRHFIPLIFLLSLILPVICMIIHPLFGLISAFSFFSYSALLAFVSYKIKDDSTSFLKILIGFIVLHFSYGIGSLLGLTRINYLFKE